MKHSPWGVYIEDAGPPHNSSLYYTAIMGPMRSGGPAHVIPTHLGPPPTITVTLEGIKHQDPLTQDAMDPAYNIYS